MDVNGKFKKKYYFFFWGGESGGGSDQVGEGGTRFGVGG